MQLSIHHAQPVVEKAEIIGWTGASRHVSTNDAPGSRVMKIIDMHTHAQDILLFPDDAARVCPDPGFLIPLTGRRGFKWYGPREGRSDTFLYHLLRKKLARETLSRNAMASAEGLRKGMKEFDIAHGIVLPV
jgi:hypothetical protein